MIDYLQRSLWWHLAGQARRSVPEWALFRKWLRYIICGAGKQQQNRRDRFPRLSCSSASNFRILVRYSAFKSLTLCH
jgi:hypothetical protein